MKRYSRIDVPAILGNNGIYEGFQVVRGEMDYGIIQKSGAMIPFSNEQAEQLRDALINLLTPNTDENGKI